jgi:hypothetical protein
MPTLDQVSKRVFSDPSWFLKCLIGGFLCLVPIAHVWVLGIFYRLADQGRRGEPIRLPEWDDWGRLFVDGLQYLLIALVYGVVPVFLGWLISLPIGFLPLLGPLARLVMVPAVLLALPLTAAGVYAFQRRHNLREAFQLRALLGLLRASGVFLIIPTLAFLGALAIGWVSVALLPFTFFIAGVVITYFYGAVFRETELAAVRVRNL